MKKNIYFYIYLVAMLLICSCSKSNKVTGTTGTVKEIINGNTIKLANGLTVKLIGVKDEPRSKEYMQSQVLDKRVRLTADSKDRKQTYKSTKTTVRAYVRVLDSGIPLNGFLLRNKISHIDAHFLNDSIQWNDKLSPNLLNEEQLCALMTPATFVILTKSGTGTGFFINDNGLALTNNHVLNGSEPAGVFLSDTKGKVRESAGRNIQRILYTDPKYDLTIFKVESENGEKFPYLSMTGQQHTRGEKVGVVGNPLGEFMTFTTGNLSRLIEEEGTIQFSAPVERGSSGGPVCNYYGMIIGVVKSMKINPEGHVGTNINYGVDAHLVKYILDELNCDYAGKIINLKILSSSKLFKKFRSMKLLFL